MLYRLIDIAKSNLSYYQDQFEKTTDDEKNKISILIKDLSPSIKMDMEPLLKTLKSHWKNRFEICAEVNGITLEEFGKLELEQQIDLICANMKPDNRVYGKRRVDFSNRYEDGLRLYYLSPNMGVYKGNSKYGKYCVHIALTSIDTDVALKYDSLVHYYNDKDEFNIDICNNDFLPYDNINFLLADKYSEQIHSEDVAKIKHIIEDDPDPLEILTTTKINASNIKMVVVSYEDFERIRILNNKRAIMGYCDSKEEEELQNYLRMQRELTRMGIKLKIAKKLEVV